MKINLAYGKRGYNIDLSDEYHIDIIEPRWVESVNNPYLAVTSALKKPLRQ